MVVAEDEETFENKTQSMVDFKLLRGISGKCFFAISRRLSVVNLLLR